MILCPRRSVDVISTVNTNALASEAHGPRSDDLCVLRTASRQPHPDQISDLVDRKADDDDCDARKKTESLILQ